MKRKYTDYTSKSQLAIQKEINKNTDKQIYYYYVMIAVVVLGCIISQLYLIDNDIFEYENIFNYVIIAIFFWFTTYTYFKYGASSMGKCIGIIFGIALLMLGINFGFRYAYIKIN